MFNVSRLTKIFVVPVFALSLAACAAIQGQETTGQYVDDATITANVKASFVADPQVKSMQVDVDTMKGVVQLSGFVSSPRIEHRAVQLAQKVTGVKSVKDNIIVRRPVNQN